MFWIIFSIKSCLQYPLEFSYRRDSNVYRHHERCNKTPGANCSKLTTSLVKVSLKSKTKILYGLANNDGHLAKKMYVDAVHDALSKTEERTWLNAIDLE